MLDISPSLTRSVSSPLCAAGALTVVESFEFFMGTVR